MPLSLLMSSINRSMELVRPVYWNEKIKALVITISSFSETGDRLLFYFRNMIFYNYGAVVKLIYIVFLKKFPLYYTIQKNFFVFRNNKHIRFRF